MPKQLARRRNATVTKETEKTETPADQSAVKPPEVKSPEVKFNPPALNQMETSFIMQALGQLTFKPGQGASLAVCESVLRKCQSSLGK